MHARTRRNLKRTVMVLAGVYLLGGAALYFFQERLLFHPVRLDAHHEYSFDDPFVEINIPFGKENLALVRFTTAEERRGVVLFFHGNMQNVEHYGHYPFLFTRNGYEVLMPDYPGFGKSTGPISEKIMEDQAMMVYRMALKEYPADSIVIYGKSIGTGVASWLASSVPCHQLILETPYYSIPSLSVHYFPVYPGALLSRYQFPVHLYLGRVNCPVTIIHGTADEIIPFSESRRLAKENNHSHLLFIGRGSHNNLGTFPLFQEYLDSLLSH